MIDQNTKCALVTGSAGFIGYHVSAAMLSKGWRVIGFDSMSDYYDLALKRKRESLLKKNELFTPIHNKIEAPGALCQVFREERPDIVIHLAAQAGVRYSVENPRAYLETNINGTFELLEAARQYKPEHMLIASTSSVYGANTKMPYTETDKTDQQISFYAATKKSTESMAHSYACLYDLPITMFRFFTAYGPWGRPDMALFKFTKSILNSEPIEIYNNGNMERDFTYIDDIVNAIMKLVEKAPSIDLDTRHDTSNQFETTKAAPYRVINIGNSKPEKLMDFIKEIENNLGVIAKKKYLPMQAGDVNKTWADIELLQSLTDYAPSTQMKDGIREFIRWYRSYYHATIDPKR
jgi:UDP-glucuronate 4-epimerase